MKKSEKILKSFNLKQTLNPKVWDNPADVNKSTLKTKVKDALLDIADKFIEYLGEDSFVDDVVLTGSLANYNWSSFSDFDLHIIIDFSQFEGDSDLYKELFNLKKQIFNEKHNIKIFGYDVELYAQDEKELHVSSGLYSVQDNEWINKPKKEKPEIDKELLKKKISIWKEKIDSSIDDSDSKKLEELKDKLKEYRQCGLEKDGELSYENLVFKYLRRSGHIEKLFNAMNKSIDKELSIETLVKEGDDKLAGIFNLLMNSLFTGSSSSDKASTTEPEQTDSENTSSAGNTPSVGKYSSTGNIGKKGNFTYLDLNTYEGFSAYKDICQKYIDHVNPNAGVSGDMMARSAKKYSSQGYVPPELALSQLAIEGGLSSNPKVRPRRTKNPFNVGNIDTGKNVLRNTIQDGIDAYYNLMTKKYLTKGKNAESLITNFVNTRGNRYATDTNYEPKLKRIISSMPKYTEPVMAKYGISKSSLA